MPEKPSIVFDYAGSPTLYRFGRSDAFIRGLMGPFRSGKSSACVIEIIRRGLAQTAGRDGKRRTRWLVVRNTYQQLADTTVRTFHQWFPPHQFGDWRPTHHSYIIRGVPGCEMEVLFRALDRPDHVRNLLSLEVTGAWVNEAREVPWSVVEAIQGRVGQYPPKMDGGCTWSGVFMDTNPPDAESKWFKFFEETKHPPEFAQIFKQPSGLSDEAENLRNLNAGRGYYEKLAQGKDPEWIKVYIHGQYGFVVEGLPVYPEYNDNLHCVECATVPEEPVYRGWDFGLTPACVFAQVTPTGNLVVVDELVSDLMGIDRFADEVLLHSSKHFPGRQFIDVGDPAGNAKSQTDERTCFSILNAKGIWAEPGLQTPTLRWESVRKPLRTLGVGGRPMFQMHPRCKVLRKGFQGGYHFRKMKVAGDRFASEADKNRYSHPHDALQYICTIIFGEGLMTPRYDGRDDQDAMDDFRYAPDRSRVTGY